MERAKGGEDFVTIRIPAKLASRLEKRLVEGNFLTVDQYVTFIAEEVLKELERSPQEEPFSKEEQASVEKKLRELGYL